MASYCQNVVYFQNTNETQLSNILETVKNNNWISSEPEQQDNATVILFFTPQEPPTEFYETLLEKGVDFIAYYYQMGSGMCGKYTKENLHEHYTIKGDSYWVEKNIPKDIDIEFSITRNMIEWE